MGNTSAAAEWLSCALKDLEESELLDKNDFYTDYPMPIIYSPSREQTESYILKTQELYETIRTLCS